MVAGTSAILVLLGGGAAAVTAIAQSEPRTASAAGRDSTIAAAVQPAAPVPPVTGSSAGDIALGAGFGDAAAVESRTSDEADRTATRGPRRATTDGGRIDGSARGGTGDIGDTGYAGHTGDTGQTGNTGTQQTPAQDTAPMITTSTVSETRPIPYRTRLVRDPSLPRGSRRVQQAGVEGQQTLRWLVTRTNGKETGRELIDTTVTRQPQHQVVAFGSQGRGWRHRHMRECGPGLDPCLPMGRSACPDEARIEESAIQLGGSVTVLDKDLALVDPDNLELCPADGPA
jgi:hypothetical protein